MEKVLNSNSLEEGTVKRSIILLYQQMIKKLPEYFSEQEISVIQHSSFSEIVVQLKEQNMLENSKTVFIFESLETMYCHLLNERNRMTRLQKNILEQESYAKMLSHFN